MACASGRQESNWDDGNTRIVGGILHRSVQHQRWLAGIARHGWRAWYCRQPSLIRLFPSP